MDSVDGFLKRADAFGTELDSILHSGTFKGWRRCRCPKCSDNRRNKTERCLGVKHPAEGDIYVICHHCGWRSGFDSTQSKVGGNSGGTRVRRRVPRKSGGLRLKVFWL